MILKDIESPKKSYETFKNEDGNPISGYFKRNVTKGSMTEHLFLYKGEVIDRILSPKYENRLELSEFISINNYIIDDVKPLRGDLDPLNLILKGEKFFYSTIMPWKQTEQFVEKKIIPNELTFELIPKMISDKIYYDIHFGENLSLFDFIQVKEAQKMYTEILYGFKEKVPREILDEIKKEIDSMDMYSEIPLYYLIENIYINNLSVPDIVMNIFRGHPLDFTIFNLIKNHYLEIFH